MMELTQQQKEWIETLYHGLKIHNGSNKVLNSLIIAQGILESAWGKSGLCVKSKNIFGVKSFKSNEPYDEYKTNEQKPDGTVYQITARFKRYESYDESIKDQVLRFTNPNGRYASLIGEKDYKKACQKVKDAGYATDISYPNKLISLIELFKLYEFDNTNPNVGEVKIKFVDRNGDIKYKNFRRTLINGENYIRLRDLSTLDNVEVDYLANENIPVVTFK